MKATTRPAYSWLVYAAAGGFVLGMVVMAALFAIFPMGPLTFADARTEAASRLESPVATVRPSAREVPAAVAPPAQTVAAVPAMSADPFETLRGPPSRITGAGRETGGAPRHVR